MMHQTLGNKVRGLATGFFGWLLVGNLLIVVWSGINKYWETLFYAFGVLTILVVLLLLFKKKTWIGYGIVVAVITNAGTWMILFIGFDWSTILLIPLPLGIIITGL